MLPLTFDNPLDYEKIDPTDKVSILGLENDKFQPGKSLTLSLKKSNGKQVDIKV